MYASRQRPGGDIDPAHGPSRRIYRRCFGLTLATSLYSWPIGLGFVTLNFKTGYSALLQLLGEIVLATVLIRTAMLANVNSFPVLDGHETEVHLPITKVYIPAEGSILTAQVGREQHLCQQSDKALPMPCHKSFIG
jgi:hypothetical protein